MRKQTGNRHCVAEPTLTVLRHREKGIRPSDEEAELETLLSNVVTGYCNDLQNGLSGEEYLLDPMKRIGGAGEHELFLIEETYECGNHFMIIESLFEGGYISFRLRKIDGDYKIYKVRRDREEPEELIWDVRLRS